MRNENLSDSEETIRPPKFKNGEVAYFYDDFEEVIESGIVAGVRAHNYPTDYRYWFEEGDGKCEWEMFKTAEECLASVESDLLRQIEIYEAKVARFKHNLQFCKDALVEFSV